MGSRLRGVRSPITRWLTQGARGQDAAAGSGCSAGILPLHGDRDTRARSPWAQAEGHALDLVPPRLGAATATAHSRSRESGIYATAGISLATQRTCRHPVTGGAVRGRLGRGPRWSDGP